MNSTFNLTSADDGSVNEYMSVGGGAVLLGLFNKFLILILNYVVIGGAAENTCNTYYTFTLQLLGYRFKCQLHLLTAMFLLA